MKGTSRSIYGVLAGDVRPSIRSKSVLLDRVILPESVDVLQLSSSNRSPAFPEFSHRPDIYEQVLEYARKKQTPVTLKDMFEFGNSIKESSSSVTRQGALLSSAAFIHKELPIRLARRVQALELLPYNMSSMPSIKRVRDWYLESFASIRSIRQPRNEESLAIFSKVIVDMLARHKHVVPTMAQGVLELKKYLIFGVGSRNLSGCVPTAAQHQFIVEMIDGCPFLQDFLEKLYLGRLGIRVLLAHHLALQNPRPGYAGIIQSQCSPKQIVEAAIQDATLISQRFIGAAPRVKLNCPDDIYFRYIPEHFHHIMFELLKNSFRAVVEHHGKHISREEDLPPVEVFVAEGDQDISIKISDLGGGIPRRDLQKAWLYSYTSAADPSKEDDDDETIPFDERNPSPSVNGWLGPLVNAPMAGFGYGLPLSRLYARCFGGDLVLIPMDQQGIDAYLYLSKLGDQDGVVLGDA